MTETVGFMWKQKRAMGGVSMAASNKNRKSLPSRAPKGKIQVGCDGFPAVTRDRICWYDEWYNEVWYRLRLVMQDEAFLFLFPLLCVKAACRTRVHLP